MNRRRVLLLLLISLVATGAVSAGNLWSYSFGLAGTDLLWSGDTGETYWRETLIGGEIRGSAVYKPTGLYFSDYINVSVPSFVYQENLFDNTITTYDSQHNLFSSVGITIGYRTDLRRLGAFFLGAGLSASVLADFDSHVWITGGVGIEFGIEFIKRKGVGFGLTSRCVIPLDSLLIDVNEFDGQGGGYYGAPDPTMITIVLGLSWANERD